jgi:hypothetical protein
MGVAWNHGALWIVIALVVRCGVQVGAWHQDEGDGLS